MNIGPARGSEHREAFPECPDPINKVLNILRLFSDLIRHLLHRATTAIADMMQLVCERVLKLLFGLGRIEIEKDCRIGVDFEDEAILARLNHRIDFGLDMRFFWQISQRPLRRAVHLNVLPLFECLGERRRVG